MMVNWLPNRIFKENLSHQQETPFYHYQWLSGKQIHCFTPPYEAFDLREQGGSPLFLPL